MEKGFNWVCKFGETYHMVSESYWVEVILKNQSFIRNDGNFMEVSLNPKFAITLQY